MSAYPWHIIGGVTADGLSFRTWRRGLVYTAEDMQDAKAKVAEPQDEFPHVYGLDNFRRGDAKVRTYILAAVLAHRDLVTRCRKRLVSHEDLSACGIALHP